MPERNLHVTERPIAEPLALERVAGVAAPPIFPFAAVLCGEWALRRRRGAR